jgi:hypothetical protein
MRFLTEAIFRTVAGKQIVGTEQHRVEAANESAALKECQRLARESEYTRINVTIQCQALGEIVE